MRSQVRGGRVPAGIRGAGGPSPHDDPKGYRAPSDYFRVFICSPPAMVCAKKYLGLLSRPMFCFFLRFLQPASLGMLSPSSDSVCYSPLLRLLCYFHFIFISFIQGSLHSVLAHSLLVIYHVTTSRRVHKPGFLTLCFQLFIEFICLVFRQMIFVQMILPPPPPQKGVWGRRCPQAHITVCILPSPYIPRRLTLGACRGPPPHPHRRGG